MHPLRLQRLGGLRIHAARQIDLYLQRLGRGHHGLQQMLAAAVASIVGKSEERAIASLFSPGGTHALKGEFAGSNDFEVIAYMVILPEQAA